MERRIVRALGLVAFAAALAATPAAADYGLAMHGDVALERGEPLPYADPDAPRGGRAIFSVLGTFDNLNVLIPRGAYAPGLRDATFGNLVYESLLERNASEPFSLYGFLASDVSVPPDRSSVTFTIDERAAFSDGHPLSAEDVVFTYELLRAEGRPYMRQYYGKVEAVETPDARTVTFHFPAANDRELPLILGLMPILPKHATDVAAFGKTTFTPPIGTGPYVVGAVNPGRDLTFVRDPDYWGETHALNAGRYNFDEIVFRFFRDETAMFEAFKAGDTDFHQEGDAGRWTTGYTFPAMSDGRAVREVIPLGIPRGMYAFVFNTRRPPFDDIDVRAAMNLLFDFPWINANLFSGQLARTDSYFTASELAAPGHPASPGEQALLAPYPGAVLPGLMDGGWAPPTLDGSGRDRTAVREALRYFAAAGWEIRDRRLVDEAGEPFTFEVLVATRDDERLALAFQRLVRPIGIDMQVRYVDSTQYNARLLSFDFDMIRFYWPASLSPGNEQVNRWSREAAGLEGSFNFAGARSAAIDAMIEAMLAAQSREAFVDAVRALDRVLLSGLYVIPLYHTPAQWVAYASRLGHPEVQSLYGFELETWWVNP
ncbi:extracellular solute-binding protein [Acuticoccus sp. I52.16.1]|uniref:extracellular solute-binding protein n=1 Tax=Acuticoccus sp. I52.16.1 TaxID=2928472 RepID=UPI001FD12CC1|nr:extracellular solute-binding protein [Acuticoccus sp. I52.16.1]UOM34564.1 extracellular solute-binding protein [Acuticoccus sp. I52.16.1]